MSGRWQKQVSVEGQLAEVVMSLVENVISLQQVSTRFPLALISQSFEYDLNVTV